MEWSDYLKILHQAEKLKNATRHSWTSAGRHESAAEHSWRLSLMAYFIKDRFPQADIDRLIKMCLLHDIGESFTGDIPSFEKTKEDTHKEDKMVDEWIKGLPDNVKCELTDIFSEMRKQESLESKLYLALDKLEAVIQHNEADIRTWIPLEYELQLEYGSEETNFSDLTRQLRNILKCESIDKIEKSKSQGFVNENIKNVTENGGRMGVIRLVLGACYTNCYLVYDKETKACMIIDPADNADEIIKCIEENNLEPRYIAITHGHTDHILAASDLNERYHAPVLVSRIDAWRLLDEDLINERPYVLEPYKVVRPSILLSEGDEIWLDGIKFSVMILAGHTPGSMALIAENAIFTGDTMLKGGHGKTSLKGGDEKEMQKSLERIKSLDGNYTIYPGHKEITTLDEEREADNNI